MSKLFIIGNGFDVNHGLKCQYEDFYNYVRTYHQKAYQRIGTMFGSGDPCFLWKQFEDNLATFDVNRSICNNLYLIEKARMHLDRNLTEYTTLENACDGLQNELSNLFREWVNNFMKKTSVFPKYSLPTRDYYFSFNYSNVLESIYQIEPSNVFHIHGYAYESEYSTPYFGHGMSEKDIKKNMVLNDEAKKTIKEVKACEQEVIQIYNKLLMDLRKKTEDRLEDSYAKIFFNRIKKQKIDEIIILGHSLGDSDKPYFEKIAKIVSSSTPVVFSYFSPIERQTIKEKLENIFCYPNIIGDNMENLLDRKMTIS